MTEKKPVTIDGEKVVLNGVHCITIDEQLQQVVVVTRGMRYRVDYKTQITVNGKTLNLTSKIVEAALEQKIAIL